MDFGVVGAGAIVTKDVPDYALVMENPARVSGWMCACGIKLNFDDVFATCKCGKNYQKYDDRVVELK